MPATAIHSHQNREPSATVIVYAKQLLVNGDHIGRVDDSGGCQSYAQGRAVGARTSSSARKLRKPSGRIAGTFHGSGPVPGTTASAAEGKNLKMQVEDVSAVSLASQRLAPREPRRDTALTAESAW